MTNALNMVLNFDFENSQCDVIVCDESKSF